VAEASQHRQVLERVGLVEADQALWARLAQQSPPLPAPFRTALFHAPVGHTQAAAVIFPDPSGLTRALDAAHMAMRAIVAARVAALCYVPGVRVVYLDLPTVCGQLGIAEILTRSTHPLELAVCFSYGRGCCVAYGI
jgi:hypothetical protein